MNTLPTPPWFAQVFFAAPTITEPADWDIPNGPYYGESEPTASTGSYLYEVCARINPQPTR